MEVSKPQPDSAEDSIDDNFDDFGFKFLCDDVESSKSTLSGNSNSSFLESAPYSRYAGNIKPINGFWVIKESPPIRELKEPRLSSQSSKKTGSYLGKSELKGGFLNDSRYASARPHFRHFVEHSVQSSNNGRKVCETKLGVHVKQESINSQKPWTGELKVRESPNLEVVYDTNKTFIQGSSRKSDSLESQTMESLVVDAGMSELGMELVKGEPEVTKVNNVHNYSWQFSPRDPRINKELLENDCTDSHKSPMKYSPRDPRIRISHDQKVTIPPSKIELQDVKKYSPRDPRIKRFHVTERPSMGQSSEDAYVSVSSNLPELRNSEDSTQRTTYNVEWEDEGQGDKYETLESQKTDKENDDTCISGSCHDQNQCPSLTKLKISRVAHSKNMYVSSFCQETSPPRGIEKVDGGLEAENGKPSTCVEKVDGGLEAENGEPSRSVENVDGDLEAENQVRMTVERPKQDLPSENDTCRFNEKAERLAKLGEKYCQAKVVVRKLQDFDVHKLVNATVETESQGHFQSTVGPQVSESLRQEKVVAISRLHKKGKKRGPRLRKELVLFSKAIPAKNIEDEVNSYQSFILPSDYITPAVKPNKSDLKGDEFIQSCQPQKDIISDIAISSINNVKDERHHDQTPRKLLVDAEIAGAGDSVQTNLENEDPYMDGNFSIEEENQGRYNDTLSTESSLLPSAQCPNDSDGKEYEKASINISEDVDINNHEQKSETNVRLLSQLEMEMGHQIPLTEPLKGKDMGLIDEKNLICWTLKMEEKKKDTGESLEKETQCASWQVNGNMGKEVKITEIEKPSCENHESEMEASSLKDVEMSHADDTHKRIVEEIQTAFQANEKQVENDIGELNEQSKLPTPAVSFLPHSEDPLLQDSSAQKSNKRHHLELDVADNLKGTGGGKLVDISSLETISPDQASVVEHLPHKKLRIDGDTILQQEGKREVATTSQSASTGYTNMDKKMGFYHKKYNRTKLRLPIGIKYLKNQWMDGGKCTTKPVSSLANQNVNNEHSVSETTPRNEITIPGKPHSPEESVSPVLDPVVAIEKLRFKLFAEAGVDLSKPSSSLYSNNFQRKLKKKTENEIQQENKTNFATASRVLKFEKEKLGISKNVHEKGCTDAVKTEGEVQSFGHAPSTKAVQIDFKAIHHQRKYNIGDARKAVQIEKRKLSEKNIMQSKRAKISLHAQKLTLRSVSKTTRVGYSKDGFVQKTIRKQKPAEVECQINSSYSDKTAEELLADNVETKKGISRNEIKRKIFAQVKKGKEKLVQEIYSKANASINMKDMLLPTGTHQFEDGLNKSNCDQHESESNDSSMEFNNHSKIIELEEVENKEQPEELKEPNCIKTEESDNMGQAENTILVNIETDNVETGAQEYVEKEHYKGDLDNNDKISSDKRESIQDPRKHSKPKQRPAKCVVCGHVFKTKELLKKHHPCRIKQTRTWSQKALRSRPNRVRKEPLPVLENKSKTSKKPRLLEGSMAHKKSKFKVVKGKTRRKVLQTIRELMEKRKPSHLPQMHILCEQLPENEQFLFQLGLLRKEKTVIDDKTHISLPISAVIVKTDAVALENLKTSENCFHDTKHDEYYSICEDEKSFPPILEKISSEFSEELSPSLTWTTAVGIPECLDPPILEPVLVPETFSTDQDSIVVSNLSNMTSDSPSAKQLTERHFTDFIEEMPETVKEKLDILKKKGTSECKLSAASFSKMKSMIKAVKSPNHSMSKSIRRHFTDAISDTETSPPMSNTACPSNADEDEENIYLREIPSGEITFAHIRNMLTHERERKISKHSLMKLNKDLAELLTSVKSKSRYAENVLSGYEHSNDPERTSTATIARNFAVSFASVDEHSSLEKIQTPFKETGLSVEEGFSEINDLRDPTVSANLEEKGKLKVTDQEIQSRSCIRDNIMGMLSSLEDKGNLADNMKNVLQLLAANLGIQFSEITQGVNSNTEQEGTQQDKKQDVTAEGCRSEYDEFSDLENVGHATADGSEPSVGSQKSVSVGSERGNQPKNVLDQIVPEDSFVSYEKFNRAGDNEIDRGLLSNDNEEDSLKEQVFDLLKYMVNRVENEEIKSIKFVYEVSRSALDSFELFAGNHNNLHQALSDMDGILASGAQIQNDSEGSKEEIQVFGSLHEQLDDSKLVFEGRNDDDVNLSENDNPGDRVKERLLVNEGTENSKEDRCLPDKELELVPSTVVSSRFYSEESEMRREYHPETSKTEDKVCILETEYRDKDVLLVHENPQLDKEYYSAFQVTDKSGYLLEQSDSQSKKPVCHDKVKERWCPYTGYAIESDDTNDDLVAESENKCQSSLFKKEHTDVHYNEASRKSIDDENKFVVIPDISGIHSNTVSNDAVGDDQNASLLEKNYIQATSNSNYVEYKSTKTSDGDDKKEDYDTKPCSTTVTTVSTHESVAGHEFIYQIVEDRNLLHIPLGIRLDEVEKEDLTMVKGIVSVHEQLNVSVTGSSHDYLENHNKPDSKSASSLEANSIQTVSACEISTPDAPLHISKIQLQWGERSSPVALGNVISGEHTISRGDHEMEYDNIAIKADYIEWGLKLSSEESHQHDKVLDEHVAKDSLITDDSQSIIGIVQSQSPIIETSSKLKTSIATVSDVTATEIASYCSKETLSNNGEQNENIDKEYVEDSAKAETVINEFTCFERKREFNETVSEGSDITENDVKRDKEVTAWSKDVDKIETKSLDSFTFDRSVTNRYETEAESFHDKCERPEECKNNEQREDSSDACGAVKEVITFSGNNKDLLISLCDQQSLQVSLSSEKVLPCFVNIISENEVSEKNQPKLAYESHSLSVTNQEETGGERDTAQQKLYTRGIDSVASTSHCENDEIVKLFEESKKMCSLYSGDIAVQSPVLKEPEQNDDKLIENEAGTEKHKSYTSLCQDAVVGEYFLGQSSEAPNNDFNHAAPTDDFNHAAPTDDFNHAAPNDDFNHAVPNIDSHGGNLHVDLILRPGMEQVDKDTDIVADSCFVSYKDGVPNSSHKPVIYDSVKSDVSEEVNDSSDIVSDINFIAEECHYSAGTLKSNSTKTEIGREGTNEHKYQDDTTLNDSLKNEKEFGLTDYFKIPKQEIIKKSDSVDLEVGNTIYKLNTSNSVVDETVVEMENSPIEEPKDVYDNAVDTDPVKEIHSTCLKHCQTGLITKCDLLLKKDCDVQSNEQFHKKPIVPKVLFSNDLPHPVSFSSLEINVGHATQDPQVTLNNIASSDDEIKKSSIPTLIGSESPVFPEHECCKTYNSDHCDGSCALQNVQQQTTDAAQEVDNYVTTDVISKHECTDSEQIPKLA